MDELQRATHKFFREIEHLSAALDNAHAWPPDGEPDIHTVDLMLSQAKRVRRESTLLVRALARHRDQLQPQEGTST